MSDPRCEGEGGRQNAEVNRKSAAISSSLDDDDDETMDPSTRIRAQPRRFEASSSLPSVLQSIAVNEEDFDDAMTTSRIARKKSDRPCR